MLLQRKTLAVRSERQYQGRIACGNGVSRSGSKPLQFISRAVSIDVCNDDSVSVLIRLYLHRELVKATTLRREFTDARSPGRRSAADKCADNGADPDH